MFKTAKNTILSGFLALPILLFTISGFLATTTANVGLMIVFLTQIFVIPGVQMGLGFLRSIGWFQRIFGLTPNLTYASVSRLSALSPADVLPSQVPPVTSYWMANLVFFASYLLSNAWALYAEPAPAGVASAANDSKVENRKAQALTSFILVLLVTVALIVTYYVYVGAETPGSVALALTVFAPLGYGVFELAKLCGLRTADLFGVSSQMGGLPGQGVYPYACVAITS